MIFDGTAEAARAILRAMASIARADNDGTLSDAAHTSSSGWDFWAHVDEPLEELRAAMGVPPLEPADTADGEYPPWYRQAPELLSA